MNQSSSFSFVQGFDLLVSTVRKFKDEWAGTTEAGSRAATESDPGKSKLFHFETLLTLLWTTSDEQWRRQWHPTPVLLPGKSRGWRSLVGCSPWGREELDMTEQLHFHFSLSCIGEGNGNPLQCSCLENPRDGGAWWATVYGVAQSQARPKWLSSSSNRSIVSFLIPGLTKMYLAGVFLLVSP